MRKLVLSAVAGVLLSPIAALAFTGTAAASTPVAPSSSAPAAGAPSGSTTQDPPKATTFTLAPSCVTFSQYKHGNFVSGYYTNVYVDNGCGTARRVKVIMRHGYDSGCLQVAAGQIDYFFRSDSDDGLQPIVERLDSC